MQSVPCASSRSASLGVLICGAGNASHVLMALSSTAAQRHRVAVYAPMDDEAARLSVSLSQKTPIRIAGAQLPHLESGSVAESMPITILTGTLTAENVEFADVAVMAVPSFAHRPLLRSLAAILRPGAVLVAFPGQGGFQWAAKEAIERGVIVASSDKLPFNARIEEFGRSVYVYGWKKNTRIGCIPPSYVDEVVSVLNRAAPGIGFVKGASMLSNTLTPANQCIHPARMFGLWNQLSQEKTATNKPLFYDDMDENSAKMIEEISQEILAIRNGLNQLEPRLNLMDEVVDINSMLLQAYGDQIQNTSDLRHMFMSNRAYQGIASPLRTVEGLVQIDSSSRYLHEDVPFGLVVLRGLADLINTAKREEGHRDFLETPNIDKLIHWTENVIGKKWLVNDSLTGPDLKESGSPQAFGISRFQELPDVQHL